MNPFNGLLLWLIVGALPVYLAPYLWRKQSPHRLGLVVLIGAWVLWGWTLNETPLRWTSGQIAFVADGVTVALGAVALTLGTCAFLFSGPDVREHTNADTYCALLLLLIACAIAVVAAADLLNLWLWFECMAVVAYILVAFHSDEPTALEATLKYFVQSVAASMLILAAIALTLAEAGGVSFALLRAEPGTLELRLLAGGLFVAGFGVKAALVPLHTWLPDAHSEAPAGISAMLSGLVIMVALAALLRVLAALNNAHDVFGLLLMGIAVLNILAGNLLALRQQRVKRLLAYSSVAHMGYVVLGIGVGLYSGQQTALDGGMFHLMSHALMKGLAFLSVGALLYSFYHERHQHGTIDISDLSGTARRYPLAALTLSIALLGLGGLPPMIGFMSKWQIFAGGVAAHDPVITVVLIAAGAGAIVSLVYYATVVNSLYRQEMSAAVIAGGQLPPMMRGTLIALALAVVVMGLLPGLLDGVVQASTEVLMVDFGIGG